jgi:hypothetical protein
VFVPRLDEIVNMKDMMDMYAYAVIEVSQQDGHLHAGPNYFAAPGISTNPANVFVLYFWLARGLL